MSLLRTIEERLGRIVEGTFGKVFRTNVQPVEIARRLVKEMDEHQHPTLRRVYVPNVYEVYLSGDDWRELRETSAALANELGEYLAEHARRAGYATTSRPKVTLLRDRDLDVGSFGIAAKLEGQPGDDGEASPAPPAPAEATMVQPLAAAPQAPAPRAHAGSFLVNGPGGPVKLSGARMTIGRGKSNDIVVQDASVSREHAELVASGGGWAVRDRDSTNGVLVNGSRVREHELAPGDRIVLGNAELRFDVDEGA